MFRDISKEDARKEIEAYYKKHSHRTVYNSELMNQLQIPLEIILEVVDDMLEDGLIERAEE